MAMTTDSFAKVRPGIYKLHKTFNDEQPHHYRNIIGRTINTENNFEEMVQMGDLGIALETREAGGITYGQVVTPYSEKVYLNQFSIGMRLSMQVAEKGLYKAFQKPTRFMSRAMYYAMEVDGAGIVNNSETGSAPHLGIDGVAFASNSHPTETSTFDNLSTAAALSATNLETTRIDSGAHLTYSDQVFMLAGKQKLLIPRALEFTAKRILNSTLQAGTANNDTNAIGDSIVYVRPNPFFTSSTRYVLLPMGEDNPIYMLNGLPWTAKDDLDSDNGTYKYFCMQEWRFRWSDARGVQFNPGA